MVTQLQTARLEDARSETVESPWRGLFKIGGAAALLSVLFFPIQILVFLLSPPPETVTGWFELLQHSKLTGLLNLDLLLMVDQVLIILIFLALYAALRRVSEGFLTIGIVFSIVAATLFIASNPAFAMLSLSSRYAAAATDTQRMVFLAAGQALIENWEGSAFHTAYILGSIAPILISVVMLRSKVFSKATAYFGILSNTIALGLYVPVIGIYISVFSVVFLWVWYILMARGLFLLGQGVYRSEK